MAERGPRRVGRVRGRWSVGEERGMGNWEIPGLLGKWGLSQGRNSEIGEDWIDIHGENSTRLSSCYGFAGNG